MIFGRRLRKVVRLGSAGRRVALLKLLLVGTSGLLVLMLGACSREEANRLTWYELVSVTGERLPVVTGGKEILDGWLEVHPDQGAVWRMTTWEVSGEGDGQPMPFAGCGPLITTENVGEPDSVSFTYRFFLEIPGVVSGWSRVKMSGTLSDGLLSLRHHDEPLVFTFREGPWDHPEIVESYDLASIAGETPPTRMDGGLLLAGRLQLYSDGTWTFVRWLEEGEMRPDTTGAVPFPFAGRLEVVEEVGTETRLLFSYLDPGRKLNSMPGLLSGAAMTLVFHEDSLVFNKRR